MPVIMKPTSQIKARLGIDPNGEAQIYFTKRCKDYMDPFVPYDEGTLSTDVDVQPTFIVYQQKYAGYQYYGQRRDGTHKIVNRSRAMHPLASSYWDKKMKTARMNDLVREMQEKFGGKR